MDLNGRTNEIFTSVKDDIENFCNILLRAKLNAKILKYLINNILMVRLAYTLGPNSLLKKELDILAKMIRYTVKKILMFPKRVNINIISLNEGFGIHSLEKYIEARQLSDYLTIRGKKNLSGLSLRIWENRICYEEGSVDSCFTGKQITLSRRNITLACMNSIAERQEITTLVGSSISEKLKIQDMLGNEYNVYEKKLKRMGLKLYEDLDTTKELVSCNIRRTDWFQRMLQICRNFKRTKANEENLISGSNIQIWTDGSLKSIEGKIKLGCGYVILRDGDIIEEKSHGITSEFPSSTTSELHAIIFALLRMDENSNLTIFTDSQAALQTVTNEASLKYQEPEGMTIKNIIKKRNLSVEFRKVKSHTGIMENDIADKLANNGLKTEGFSAKKYVVADGQQMVMFKGEGIQGSIWNTLEKINQKEYISRLAKSESTKNLMDAMPSSYRLRRGIWKNILALNNLADAPSLRNFNLKRLYRILPINSNKFKWYSMDPSCKKCNTNEEETQEHFFSCTAKEERIKRLLNQFNVLGKSYKKDFSCDLEIFTQILTNGYIPLYLIDEIIKTKISNEIAEEMIKSMYNVVNNSCRNTLWIPHWT
jgi:ribonuclease HI